MNAADEADKEDSDPTYDVISKHAELLMEHVTSIRIFCTVVHPARDTTSTYVVGRGDYFSVRGLIDQWINQERAKERREAEREVDNDDSE